MGFGYCFVCFFIDKEVLVIVFGYLWQVSDIYYLSGFVKLMQEFIDYGGGWVVDVNIDFVKNQCWCFYFVCGNYLNSQCNV